MTRIFLIAVLAVPVFAQEGAKVGGDIAPDGTTQVQCDLPKAWRLQNKGGKDGAGLCVFTSINHSAYYQNVDVLQDFRDWMTKHPGGGYPEKVDRMIEKICKERNIPKPQYIQVEGADLELLKMACKTGRMPSVTYAFSPSGRYNGQKISHMVSCVSADDKWFSVLDNNYIQELEWMSPQEFQKTFKSGGAWCVILLSSPPPPPPRN